jgi:hypothetical protein
MKDQTQLDRMEDKIDELITQTSKNTTEITWIKSVGGLFMTALAFLFNKALGGP